MCADYQCRPLVSHYGASKTRPTKSTGPGPGAQGHPGPSARGPGLGPGPGARGIWKQPLVIAPFLGATDGGMKAIPNRIISALVELARKTSRELGYLKLDPAIDMTAPTCTIRSIGGQFRALKRGELVRLASPWRLIPPRVSRWRPKGGKGLKKEENWCDWPARGGLSGLAGGDPKFERVCIFVLCRTRKTHAFGDSDR